MTQETEPKPFNRDRLFVNKERGSRPVTLNVPLRCTVCNVITNSVCENHDATTEKIELTIAPLSWARFHQIRSNSAMFDNKNNRSYFDLHTFYSQCLKEIIVNAPWGETTDMILLQVTQELGYQLEQLVPELDGSTEDLSIDEIKKV